MKVERRTFPMKVIVMMLVGTCGALAQAPTPEPSHVELGRLFWDGMKTTQLASSKGLRYIETEGDQVLTVERDQNGAARAYVTIADGVFDSECIVIGDRIYERSGTGPWTMRMRADFRAQLAARSDALQRARAENDSQAYMRIFAAGPARATMSAINSPHVAWFGQGRMNLSCESGFLDDCAVISHGLVLLKGRSVRHYRITGVKNTPTVRGIVRRNTYEADYWFDAKSGAIVQGIVKRVEDHGRDSSTSIVQYEWELAPQLVINAPAVQR